MSRVQQLLPKAGLMAALALSITACSEAKQDTEAKPAESKIEAGYEAPRNSQGQPNLQGIWDFRGAS